MSLSLTCILFYLCINKRRNAKGFYKQLELFSLYLFCLSPAVMTDANNISFRVSLTNNRKEFNLRTSQQTTPCVRVVTEFVVSGTHSVPDMTQCRISHLATLFLLNNVYNLKMSSRIVFVEIAPLWLTCGTWKGNWLSLHAAVDKRLFSWKRSFTPQ